MHKLLEKVSRNRPNEVGFVCEDINITYGESWQKVKNLSDELKKRGVLQGDKVGFITENPMEFINIFMALSYCGAVIIPIYLKTGIDKINDNLNFFDIKYVLTNATDEELSLDAEYSKESVTCEDGYSLYENKKLKLDPSLAGVRMILFSSGTTNIPKAVMLSEDNIYSNITAIIGYLGLNEEDRILIVKNMNHASSIVGEFLVGVAAGSRIYFTRKLARPGTILKLIETDQITMFFAIPLILENLLEYKHLSKHDISSLKNINFYGGKLQHNKIMALCQKMPLINFIYSYGLTEASPRVTYIMKQDLLVKDSSCGRVINGVSVTIRDDDGNNLPNGTEGEITVQGPNVMQGYYRNEEQTKRSIRNHVLYTKDLGYKDDDGFLYVTGRKDNMFIIAGKNVHPEEIESVLNSDEGVKDSLVMKEKTGSETIKAYVTLNQGSEISQERLFSICHEKLEFYKVPTDIIIVSEFQRTVSGKIVRNQKFVS